MTIEVQVRGNNVEKAMRVLKKKLLKDGLMRELKERQHYCKPSHVKREAKKQQIRRFKRRFLKELLDVNMLPISDNVKNKWQQRLEGVDLLWVEKP